MSIVQQIALQVILILINAFFAATEIAVISLNRTKLEKLAEEGDSAAGKLMRLTDNQSAFLSTIQIGITLAGFLGSAFAADNLAEYISPAFISMGLPVGASRTIAVIIITLIISFFTLIFSAVFLKERISLKTAVIITGAFIGALFVIKPSFSNADLSASIIGLIGGLGAGSAYTCVRALGKRGTSGPLVVLFFSLFSCLVTLPYLIFSFHPLSMKQFLILMLAGTAAAGGQFSITAAYRFAPAREISVYDYSQVIFTALLGFFVFSQIPDGYSFLGYAIIILMAVIMYISDRRTAHAA